MRRLSFAIVLSSLLAMASGATKHPRQTSHSNLDSVLGLMDASSKSFKSLTADIEDVKYTAVVKDTSTETGQILVRHDQKMRIEFTKPDKRTILRTGDSLFIYTPKLNRVEEYNLGKNRAMVDQYLSLGFGSKSESLRKNYDIKIEGDEDLDSKKVVVLELTPKSSEVRAQITKIEMWIDQASWLPIQQKFYEATAGDYFQCHYTNVKENLKIGDSSFKPEWPKGVTSVHPQM